MKILREVEQPSQFQWIIFCPGCKCGHGIRVGQSCGPNWEFNGNVDSPTFTPSLLVSGVTLPPVDPETGDWERGPDGKYITGPDGRILGSKNSVCHSYITDGNIQFLGDCTHELKGQKVQLPQF